jgi:GR25 family glycosyltransferase involved in LPS biosynthesis
MINIYVIKSEHLQNRWKSIDITVNKIGNLIQSQKMKYSVITITSPTVEEIEKNIADYNNQINLTEEVADEDFKKLQSKFNLAQLSNLLKHKKAYDLIKKSNNKHNLILEDDVLLPEEHYENFSNCLKLLNNIEYDILFTCVSNNNENAKKLNIELSTVHFKVLPTKSSYFLTPEMASKLHEYLTIIRFTIKPSLSKYVYDNKNSLQSYILNKHTFVEGSKMGVFSSVVNPANIQIQNTNFIQMIEMYNNYDNDNSLFDKALDHFNKTGKGNPEFLHLMGLLYYKKNDYNKALEYIKDAVFHFKKKEGYIPQFNEILNNCINMYKFCQDDIKECFAKSSIYCP